MAEGAQHIQSLRETPLPKLLTLWKVLPLQQGLFWGRKTTQELNFAHCFNSGKSTTFPQKGSCGGKAVLLWHLGLTRSKHSPLMLLWENEHKLNNLAITQPSLLKQVFMRPLNNSVTADSNSELFEINLCRTLLVGRGLHSLCRVCSLHTVCQAGKTHLFELSFTWTSVPRSKNPWWGSCPGGNFMSY